MQSMIRRGAGFLVLAVLLGVPLARAARAEEAAGLLDLEPWQLAAYEGSVASVETPAGQGPGGAPVDLAAAVSFLVLPAEDGPGKQVLLVRAAIPRTDDQVMPPLRDTGLHRAEEGLRLAPLAGGDPPPQAGLIDRLLPVALFPSIGILEPGEVERRERVVVYGGAAADLPLRVRVEKAGPTVTVTRSLASAQPVPVDIDGSPSTVERWSETHAIDTERRVLAGVRREHRVSLRRGEERIVVDGTVELKLKSVRVLDAASRARAAALGKDVRAILDGFGARKPPREIYDLIKGLAGRDESRLVDGLEDALVAKLGYYRLAREEEQRREAVRKDPWPAPDFTLESLDGKKVSLREAAKGKVTLLAFWGYGCPPCRAEAPYLTKLQETYGDRGFTVLAVNAYDEPRELVRTFVEQAGLKHPILLGGGRVARDLYHVRGLPASLWIDRAGNVVARESGFSPSSFPRMEARVKEMIGAGKAEAGKP
jgi:thiol-disulfide isomerase/thioredoxin